MFYQQQLENTQPALIYFIYGGEPLQTQEAQTSIRQLAKKQGFTERLIKTLAPGFCWQEFSAQSNSMGLFASKKLIELNLPNNSLPPKDALALIDYIQHLPDNTQILITANHLKSSAQKSNWFKTLAKLGTIITAKPLESTKLPAWFQMKLKILGFSAQPDILLQLAYQYEGNLLAADQFFKKLPLFYPPGKLDEAMITPLLEDNAQFPVFALADAALYGNVNRTLRIFQGLRKQGEEAIVLLWTLTRELRHLFNLSYDMEQSGYSFQKVLSKHPTIWKSRAPILQRALNRLSHQMLKTLLQNAHKADNMIKHESKTEQVWEILLSMYLQVAGITL